MLHENICIKITSIIFFHLRTCAAAEPFIQNANATDFFDQFEMG